MSKVLLIIIYISFIGLGLPDAILGSAWPAMHGDLGVEISKAGVSTLIVFGGSIISSLFSERLMNSFSTSKIIILSILLTSLSLIGISFSQNFILVCALSVPLGLGAGGVDSVLNNFVAIHYDSKHMNWLHCFWGIGATSGPLIISICLLNDGGWRTGYLVIGSMLCILAMLIFISLPLWSKVESNKIIETNINGPKLNMKSILDFPNLKYVLITFFCYCSLEQTTGLWASTYLVVNEGMSVEQAAKWVSFYFLGITIGRLISGFISTKLDNKTMIRIGQFICIIGIILFMLPASLFFKLSGIVLIGFGCSPIYPAMIHDTPNRFSSKYSQSIMGIQIASGYVGNIFTPFLFGSLSEITGVSILPCLLFIMLIFMIISSEKINTTYNK